MANLITSIIILNFPLCHASLFYLLAICAYIVLFKFQDDNKIVTPTIISIPLCHVPPSCINQNVFTYIFALPLYVIRAQIFWIITRMICMITYTIMSLSLGHTSLLCFLKLYVNTIM
jgi:hypothetical protein